MRLTTGTAADRDAGFTLIELLVAISILGLIAIPLGNAVIGYVQNAKLTTDRLVLSHDAQISAAYFARDVAGMGIRQDSGPGFKASIQIDAAYNAGGHTCGNATTPTARIRFLADDWGPPGSHALATAIVAYYLEPAGGVSELHRMKCAGSATPVSDVVVAHNVDPSTPVESSCTTACLGSTPPTQVTLTFSVRATSSGEAYPITLTGQRRQT